MSPNNPPLNALFNQLSSKVDHIEETFPNAEIVILGDFNVHNNNWLKYSIHTESAGLEAEAFVITHEVTQIVKEPTCIRDNVNHQWNIFNHFLTSDPDKPQLALTLL